jgi:hypothetical protein
MMLGFLRADHSRLHQPAHIGVVARYPRNLAVADQVEPGVADVHVIEFVITISAAGSTVATIVRSSQRITNDCRAVQVVPMPRNSGWAKL